MEMNKFESYKALNRYVRHTMQNFLNLNWYDFCELSVKVESVIRRDYRLSNSARVYFLRLLHSYETSYAEIIMCDNTIRYLARRKFC